MSLDFKSESLHSFLENVVQIVNQHSQRINAVELDKAAIEDLRRGNISVLNAGKLNPALTKELSVQNPNKTDSLNDTVESISTNFSNHSNGIFCLTKRCSTSRKGSRSSTSECKTFLDCWTRFKQSKTSRKG